MRTIWYLLIFLLLPACAAGPGFTAKSVKWVDPDNQTIPQPKVVGEYQKWDFVDHTLVYQVGKLLDLEWTGRRVGRALNIGEGKQADNLNALDEVPNSSWFTNRHFLHPMPVEDLVRGPGFARPDMSGPWEIVSGKFHGRTSGFTIKDPKGTLFLLKFDVKDYEEMASSAEIIGTKILHAAGYNVPKNSVIYFHPSILRVGSGAQVGNPDGTRRSMAQADLDSIFSKTNIHPDGRVRCVASEYLKGTPLGPFTFHGRRRDDPNDRVLHEHRRELRGLRVISSWLNDADRRTANTLDTYVTDAEGRRFVKHHLIDMGSILGSNSWMPHLPRYGNEYLWDPGTIARSLLGLGFYTRPWETPMPLKYPSIGYYENETFHPGKWVPTYPNPAFQWCTGRDGYWGAKIVMAFTDEQVVAIVKAGQLTDPEAEAELTRLMIERRDRIGRYWFAGVNPLDRFGIGGASIVFDDLAVAGGLASASGTAYRYHALDARGRRAGPDRVVEGIPRIPLERDLEPGRFYGFEVRTRRDGETGWSKYTRVYFYAETQENPRIVRVVREE